MFGSLSFAMDAQDHKLLSSAEFLDCLLEVEKRSKRLDRGRRAYKEVSAWVVIDSEVKETCVLWKSTNSVSGTWKGSLPKGTVANIHSHPRSVERGVSEDDVVAATQINLPVYVMHARGDWLYKALPGMERNQIGLRVGTGSVRSIVKKYK